MDGQSNIIKFRGVLICSDGARVPIFSTVEYHAIDSTYLNIELALTGDESTFNKAYEEIYSRPFKNLVIENGSDRNLCLEISNIRGFKHSSEIFNIDAQSFRYGIKNSKILVEDRVIFYAKLVPGDVAGSAGPMVRHYDGSVRKLEKEEYETPYWETDLGKFLIHSVCEFFDEKELGRKISRSVEATHVSLELDKGAEVFLEDFSNKALESLNIICVALSLSQRTRVGIYEIKFIVIGNRERERSFSIPRIWRFKLFDNYEKHCSDPLLAPCNFAGNNFHILASRLKESDLSSALTKSIKHLSLSRQGFLQESFFYCFLSLDSVIEAILIFHEVKTEIPSGRWRKISKILRRAIADCDDETLQDYLAQVERKLPELKRISFVDKTMLAVKLLDIDVKDIWRDKPFEDGIKEATGMRNLLFHAGEVESFAGMDINLIRLQYLVERIILASLEWNKEQVWVWHDQSLKWTNLRVTKAEEELQ